MAEGAVLVVFSAEMEMGLIDPYKLKRGDYEDLGPGEKG